MRYFPAILLPALAAGCFLATGPDDTLDGNRERWEEAAITSYRFEYHSSCFCPEELSRRTLVVVDHGAVQSVVFADTGEPVTGVPLGSWPTVPELFDRVEEGIESGSELTVEYHPELGYPTMIQFHAIPGLADSGVTHFIENLARL